MKAKDPTTHLLPLKPAVLHILLALAEEPCHGYGIMVSARESSDGTVDLGTSHLYRHLRKLLEADLVTETDQRPDDDDPRRRYYRLSPRGHELVAAEIRRLERLVRHGHDLGLARPVEGT